MKVYLPKRIIVATTYAAFGRYNANSIEPGLPARHLTEQPTGLLDGSRLPATDKQT